MHIAELHHRKHDNDNPIKVDITSYLHRKKNDFAEIRLPSAIKIYRRRKANDS